MTNGVLGKIGRGLGWASVTVVGFVLACAVAFLPLSLLPGPVHTDFVQSQLIKLAGIAYVGAMLTWRLSPMGRNVRFSPPAAGKLIWLAVSAFALAFWPLGLAVWFNADNSKPLKTHDMEVVGIERMSVRPAVTPIQSFELRELSTGWTANLEVTDDRKRFAMPGRCVRIFVRAGRLGLDWISDARPITCPLSDS